MKDIIATTLMYDRKKEDVQKIKKLESKGIAGVIIGKALYTGDIKLKEIL